MIPHEVSEAFRKLLQSRFDEPPEQRRHRFRRKDIGAGLMLIGLAIASPVLYVMSGVVFMMSGTSPIGWTITACGAAFLLWVGISILARKS